MSQEERFNKLIADALSTNFSGWDFSYLQGRWQGDEAAWDYSAIVESYLPDAESLLDMGTGGGEKLSALSPLPPDTHATEAWEPNLPVAKKRLEPLGIQVHHINEAEPLPFIDERFDCVINRHEFYQPEEVYRILKTGGHFITQQVGGAHGIDLNEWITGTRPAWDGWGLSKAHYDLHRAGFKVLNTGEDFGEMRFLDIGAVVYYLKVISWQIPDFDVDTYRPQLMALHQRIEKDGFLPIGIHYFWLETLKE